MPRTPGSADHAFIRALRHELANTAQPERAPQMQAYMKSTMPYLGVRVPAVRAVVRTLAREFPPANAEGLEATVSTLWSEAQHREERYAATALLDVPDARRLRRPGLLALLERLIVDGAWWDHVDELSRRVGDLLIAFPDDVRTTLMGWQRSPDRWLRRSSIICQLGARAATDLDLLTGAIGASADESDFFVRKAIGWALREYARTDPQWVRDFVAAHQLSPLSVREATRHLPVLPAKGV